MTCARLVERSSAGYRAHRAAGESSCPECSRARREHEADLGDARALVRPVVWDAAPARRRLAEVNARPWAFPVGTPSSMRAFGEGTARALLRGRLNDRQADEVAVALWLMPWELWPGWHGALVVPGAPAERLEGEVVAPHG